LLFWEKAEINSVQQTSLVRSRF